MLTAKKIKEAKPRTILKSGISLIPHPYPNEATKISRGGTLEKDEKRTKVKWVAVRGNGEDWAVYHSMNSNFTKAEYFDDPEHLEASKGSIRDWGTKLHDEKVIKRLVSCSDEALKLYRH